MIWHGQMFANYDGDHVVLHDWNKEKNMPFRDKFILKGQMNHTLRYELWHCLLPIFVCCRVRKPQERRFQLKSLGERALQSIANTQALEIKAIWMVWREAKENMSSICRWDTRMKQFQIRQVGMQLCTKSAAKQRMVENANRSSVVFLLEVPCVPLSKAVLVLSCFRTQCQ